MRLLSGDFNGLGLGAKAGGGVDGEHGALQAALPGGCLIAAGQIAPEFGDGLFRTDAQDGFLGAGHADVGLVAGALAQHTAVGGGNVGVGAPDGADAAVKHVTHGQFLRGGLGVEVQQDQLGVQVLEDLVDL